MIVVHYSGYMSRCIFKIIEVIIRIFEIKSFWSTMTLVKVHHYLTQEGLRYFSTWFDELFSVIQEQEGYREITCRLDK